MTFTPANSHGAGYPLGLTGATTATRYVGGTASAAPVSGTFEVGDFVITAAGTVFVCTVSGTPGTWVQAGGGTQTWPIGSLKTGSAYYYAISSNPSTRALLDQRMYASPFPLPTATIDRIGLEVTTLGAGSVIRLGIYSDSGFLTPGALLLDAGTINSAGIGNLEKTVSQAVTAGWYWMVACMQGGAAPSVRTNESFWPFLTQVGAAAPTGSTAPTSYFQETVAGALPANFASPPSQTFTSPKVYVRLT